MLRVPWRSLCVRALTVGVSQAIIVICVLQSIDFPARRGCKGSERLFVLSVIGNAIYVIFVSDEAGSLPLWAIIPMEGVFLLPLSRHHPIRPIKKTARAEAGASKAMTDPMSVNL